MSDDEFEEMAARVLVMSLRGVTSDDDPLTCDRCGYVGPAHEFEPEEAGEWECRPCNTRLNDIERLRAQATEGEA